MPPPNDWSDVRRFGARRATPGVVVRPCAYGFIADRHGRLAVVRSEDGTFLPGGGIEAGETPEAALVREALEECGLLIRVGACVSRAVQLVTREADGVSVEKRSFFFDAAIEGERPADVVPGHETLWVPPGAAGRFLSHQSQVWAVDDWRSRAAGR